MQMGGRRVHQPLFRLRRKAKTMRAMIGRLPIRQLSTGKSKEELWKMLHPIPDVHKAPRALWQVLHPLPVPKTGCNVKQQVFEEKVPSDLWQAMHPIPETTRVPDHHIHLNRSSGNATSTFSQTKMGGWSSFSGSGELWKSMHPVAGITFRPRN